MIRPTPGPRHLAALLPVLLGVAGCADRPAGPVAALEPVYCYDTLADVACYPAPDRGRERQLVGVYGRDPDDPAWPDYWLRRAAASP